MSKTERARILIGPAGWSYKDWDGTVYPKPKPRGFDPLAYLAQFIDCIEINSSFYYPAPEKNCQSWLKRIEQFPDFRFTMKLWQRFTHEREPFSEDEVKSVKKGLDIFMEAGRLGAVLVQFPWSFKNNEADREWLHRVLEAFAGYPLALEVRHASWNVEPFYDYLAERHVGFVNIDQPIFGRSLKPSAKATAKVGYVRLHGQNHEDWFREDAGRDERYDYLYSPGELVPWVARIKKIAADCDEVYVITNNHYRGQALANAIELKAMIGEKSVHAPEILIETYPRLSGVSSLIENKR